MSVTKKRKSGKSNTAILAEGLLAGLISFCTTLSIFSILINNGILGIRGIKTFIIIIHFISSFVTGITLTIKKRYVSIICSMCAAIIICFIHTLISMLIAKGRPVISLFLLTIVAAAAGSVFGKQSVTALTRKGQSRKKR